MHIRLLPAAAAATLLLAVAGCGGSSPSGGGAKPVDPNGAEVNPAGDIPDNQAFVAYSPSGAGFSVKVPEGWSRIERGGAVVFTDKLNSIRSEWGPAGGKPSGRPVQRRAGTAYLTRSLVKSTPDAVTGRTSTQAVERYVFVHKGKQVVLTLSGAKGADNVDPWRIVTDSLRWTS
jgi:hypothetical protein